MALQPATSQFEALDLRSFRAQQTSFDRVHGYYQRSVTLTARNAVPVSIPLARSLRSLLFDVAALDPTVYALVVLSLLAAVALAVCGPALRATQTDPITALRSE